ncbi:Cardioacceleratory peptide receptor [Mizuhopecten yessoensis]|uniref:Cardioacceleratory peptide receptor n=1 Tax=Mizuhopecten yessoensis TaxID=6573 RepID=A0A210QTK3_MIZYE|nr:Cardioacceleratory peptide receptor [Mizuhopecten yessoensis]
MSNNTLEPIYEEWEYIYPWSNDTSLHSDCAWVLPIQQAILGVELILTLILNGTVILLIIRKGKRNKMSFFVLNLAISDFSMAIFYILPFFITRLVGHWYAGYGPCKMYMYLNQLAMYSSTYMLVVMSADRVYAIAKPLSATRRGLTYRRLLVVSAWAVAACVAVKDLLYSDLLAGDNGVKLCETVYPESLIKPFITLEAVVNVFFPALIVTICYGWIVTVVSRRIKYAINAKQQKAAIDMFSKNILSGNGKTDGKRTDVVRRAKIRSTKVMFAVVSVFLISWSPHTINFLLMVYEVVDFTCTTFILFPLAPLNSMANPIVFLAFNYNTLFVHNRKGSDLNRTSMKTTFSTFTRNSTERTRDLLVPANIPARDA